MKAVWRFSFRAIMVLAVIAVAAWIFYLAMLPAVVGEQVAKALRAAGFRDIQLDVRQLSLNRFHVSDLKFDQDDRLRVGSIEAQYSIGDLRRQRIHTLKLSGIEWLIRWRDGKLDFAPLDQLRPADGPAAPLPLDRIEVAHSAIVIELEEKTQLRLPLSGVITRQGDRGLILDLAVDVLNVPIAVTGSWDLDTQSGELMIGLGTWLPGVSRFQPLLTVTLTPDHHAMAFGMADANPPAIVEAMGWRVTFDQVKLNATTDLTAWSVHSTGRVHAERTVPVEEGTIGVNELTVSWSIDDAGVKLTGDAAGPGWVAENVTATLPPLPELIHVRGQADVAGSARVSGLLLPRVAESLAGFGVDARPLRQATLTAAWSGTVDLPEVRRIDGGHHGKLGPVRLVLEPGDVRVETGEDLPPIVIQDVTGAIGLTADLDGRQLAINLDGENWVGAGAAQGGAAEKAWQLDPLRVVWTTPEDAPLFVWRFTGENRGQDVASIWSIETPVRWSMGEGTISMEASGVSARFAQHRPGEGEPVTDAEVQVTRFDAAYKPLKATLVGGSLRLPITAGRTDVPAGSLSIETLELDAIKLAGPKVAIQVADQRVKFDAAWLLIGEGRLEAKGDVGFGAGGLLGKVTAKVPEFALLDGQIRDAGIMVREGLDISGRFSVDADFDFHGITFEPMIRFGLADVTIRDGEWDAVAKGIAGDVIIDRFHPFSTPAGQRINVASIRFGKLELTEGDLRFQIETSTRFLLEKTVWRLSETGRFWVHAFRFDVGDPVIDMEVFFEGMDLQEWFDLLLEGKLAGTGKLYGRMPVQIRPDAGKKLHFGEGFLYAAPGKGEIRMLQFEVGEEVVRQALGGDQPIWQLRAARDNVLEAFRHFEYTMLRFDFRREGGLFVCRAATAGKGVKGQKQEVNLNVNLFGFDDALNNAILVKTGSDSALDRAIDRFFGR